MRIAIGLFALGSIPLAVLALLAVARAGVGGG